MPRIQGTPSYAPTTAILKACIHSTSGVLGRVTGIADLFTLAGDKQVFYAEIDADHFRCDGQDLGVKLAQAGHEIAASCVFGDRNGAGFAGE
ncbi:MAG: hypothetical protein ACRCZA_05140 [Shewanella sp.]|uniref:hypothetical protein n=1 Tax=Shewanella sp. TaxID=50422 RepID=UPI003F418255